MQNVTRYPLIPVRNTVVFPGTIISLVIGRNRSVAALEEAHSKSLLIAVATERVSSDGDPNPEDIYRIGTLCSIEDMRGNRTQGYQIVVRGVSRFRIAEVQQSKEFLSVSGEYVADLPPKDPIRLRALLANLKELSKTVLSYVMGAEMGVMSRAIDDIEDPSYMANLAATYLNISTSQKQELLEDTIVERRIESLLGHLTKERDVLQVQKQIHEKISEQMTEAQRKSLLRQQLETIQEELGEGGEDAASDVELSLKEAQLPPEVDKVAQGELNRLKSMSPQSSEYHILRSYLELLAEMPWQKVTKDVIELPRARKILDEDHYGMEDVKKRILEFLAVAKLKNDLRGPILCLLGPPGVGKTSLGQSVARVLDRKFVRSSLGGIRDEAEIMGHRRTYVGAMPGRIIQAIRRAGVKNPVFMLDEIDKLGISYHGDPASSLLEVLDPEQNRTFLDHYLDVPFDLSSVFFLATANVADTIPAPLLDRMEIIELTGYTSAEKMQIATQYILPKQLKEHGLTAQQVVISREILDQVIAHYTREAGVRELQRQIAGICRWSARQIVEGKSPPLSPKVEDLHEILGPERFFPEVSERPPVSGIVTGLSWTPHGGDILFVEASLTKGTGQILLTGQLGEVMKESAQIAMSLVRRAAHDVCPRLDFEKQNIHIHVPAGAIPKDGPSAGVTMLSALVSLVMNRTVDPKLAMTGEITLRGAVLPVGGIKEKILAAHRAGIRKVILPQRNRRDLARIPEEVRSKIELAFVETVDDLTFQTLGVHIRNGGLRAHGEHKPIRHLKVK